MYTCCAVILTRVIIPFKKRSHIYTTEAYELFHEHVMPDIPGRKLYDKHGSAEFVRIMSPIHVSKSNNLNDVLTTQEEINVNFTLTQPFITYGLKMN